MGPRSTRSRSAVQVRIAVIAEVSTAFGGLCNMCVCLFYGRFTSSVPQTWEWLMAEEAGGWLWL